MRRGAATTARLLVAAPGLAALALRPPFAVVRLLQRRLPGVLFFTDTTERVVALTLDDGPDPVLTPRVLEVLAAHDARATFFVLGERAQGQPALLRAIAAAGHELGNHTWRDEPTVRLAPAALEASLRATARVLEPVAPVTLFRPGSGWLTARGVATAERLGYRCVLGSVYPHDPQIRVAGYAAWDVLRRVRPGAIVVLHEGRPDRERVLTILDAVLSRLRREGFRVTTVSDLLCAGRGSQREMR